ncbi:hypothetical protein ACWCQQ_01815 [Streptomyces sp. NPDC002143]
MSELYAGGETDVEEVLPPPGTRELPEADDTAEPVEPMDDHEPGDAESSVEEPEAPDEAADDSQPSPEDGPEDDEEAEPLEPLDADDTDEADEVEEADEAEAEGVSETDAKIGELEKQGHGPQRHLHPTSEALKERKGEPKTDANDDVVIKNNGHVRTINHVNPETGSTQDVKPDGTTSPHRCGDYATKFTNAEDYVRAEEYLREKAIDSGDFKVTASIEEIFGPGDHSDRFEGYYVDPDDPTGTDDSVNHLPVDFEDGHIVAVYNPGTGDLHTMYPDPEPGRHP